MLGTGGASFDPCACGGDELLMRQRGQSPRGAVNPAAGLEGPQDQRLFFVVLQETWSIKITIFLTINNRPADLGARQDLVMHVLPLHRQGCQVPVMPARDSGTVGVGLLMTGNTLKRRNTLAVRPAHHIGEVAMPIVALLRIIGSGVAVDAARMGQHGIDLLPGGKALRAC